LKAIRRIADKHKLLVIEDCAHCVEGSRDGIRPGALSDDGDIQASTPRKI